MFIRAARQLELPKELDDDDDDDDDDEDDLDVPKHVPHFAMMLSTALSHFESAGMQTGPATQKKHRKENTSPRKARFIVSPHELYWLSISSERRRDPPA
jgi:hypothetical protein